MSSGYVYRLKSQLTFNVNLQMFSVVTTLERSGLARTEMVSVMQIPITPELRDAVMLDRWRREASQQEGAKDGDDGLTG